MRSGVHLLALVFLFLTFSDSQAADSWSLAIYGNRLSAPSAPPVASAQATATCTNIGGANCVAATYLGSVCGDLGQDQITLSGCGPGWFQFTMSECNAVFLAVDLTCLIRLTPLGATDYDLYLYDLCGSPIASSTQPVSQFDQVTQTVTDNFGQDDSHTYEVEVRPYPTSLGVDDPKLLVGEPRVRIEGDPNPMRTESVIRYWLPATCWARVMILDVRGARVRTFDAGIRPRGQNQIRWDGRDALGNAAPSGVYFARVEALGAVGQRKIALLR